MGNRISKERAVSLLSEIINHAQGIKSEDQREVFIWQIIPLIRRAHLGNNALPLLCQLLNLIHQFDERTMQALLFALLNTVDLCDLGESEKRLILMEMGTVAEGISDREFREAFEKFIALSLIGLDQEETELLLDMAKEILKNIEEKMEMDADAFLQFLSLMDTLLSTHLKEQALQLLLDFVDAIASLSSNKDKIAWWGVILQDVENKVDEEGVEKILSKILQKASDLPEEWRGALLCSISSKLVSLGLKDDSPLYAEMLEMAKGIENKGVREETLSLLLAGLLKAGADRSLVERELENVMAFLDEENRFRRRLSLLSEVFFLAKEGKFEAALEKALGGRRFLREAFLIVANEIIRAVGENE